MRWRKITVCLVIGAAAQVWAQAPTQGPAPPPAPATSADQGNPAASAATLATAQNAVASPAEAEKYVVPAGTKVLLSLKSALNTRTAQPGDGVYLVSNFPVVIDGHVLIPNGVYVQGVVDRVERAGRVKGRAQISMHFTSLIFPNGQVVSIPGTVDSLPGSAGPKVKGDEGTVQQSGNKGHDVGTVAKGATMGAGYGTIGGAVSGSWIAGAGYGALAGATAGAISTLFTRGQDIVLPEGSQVEMVLQRPMELAAQQYASVDDQNAPKQQFAPLNAPPPLQKPARQAPCSNSTAGCN